MHDNNPNPNRAVFLLSVIGMAVAGFLWHLHATHGDIPCGVSRGCEIVAESAYAHFPDGTGPWVAAWGTFGYLGFAMIAFLRTMALPPARDRMLLGILALGAVAGTLFSLRLTYLELYVIHAVCKWCISSQIIIALIATIAVAEWFGSRFRGVGMKLTGETKLMIGAVVAILLLIGAYVGIDRLQNKPAENNPPPPPPLVLNAAKMDEMFAASRHTEGKADAALTIIEFADFQCPSCRRAYNNSIVKFGKTIPPYRLAFYNLPLPMHERAKPAAYAAEAAAKQGKFWEMYAALFNVKSEGLDDAKIAAAAKTAGVDAARFKADLTDTSLKGLVEADMKLGEDDKISSTPTFFIHDKAGNTAIVQGAGNLERLLPDLKDGVIGNDVITPPDAQNGAPIVGTVGGKQTSR